MNDYDAMFYADIDSTFLRDFGKEHRIGSRKVRCVIDTNVGTPNPGLMSEPYYGLSTNQLRIFVKKGDIPTPEVNQNLSVDGSFHRVAAISDEVGMLVITCEENNE